MSIADEILRLQGDSTAIASAIAAKGVTVPSGSGYDDYATLISQISGGGYELAEYIQTSGNAYLNTGIVQISRNIEYTLKLAWTGTTAGQFEVFFGYMAANDVTPRCTFSKNSSNWMYGTNASLFGFNTSVNNNVHTFRVSGNSSTQKDTLFIDGVLSRDGDTTSTGLTYNAIPYYLGCRNRDGSIDNPCYARFYSLNYRYFNEAAHTTLLAEYNFIPVRFNGVYGMFETIAGTFHSSISGTDFSGQLK